MIRWLLYRFVPYFSLLFLLLGSALLIGSEAGLQLLWRQLEPRLPPGIEIGAVNGRLISRIGVSDVRINNENLDLTVDQAWLHWQPLALLRAEIRIKDVVVAGGRITLKAAGTDRPAPAPLPDTLPRLPNLRLERLVLRGWHLETAEGAVHEIRSARLQGRLRGNRLHLQLGELDSPQWGRWALDLDTQLGRQRIELAKLAISREGAPPLKLEASGNCPWPSLTCQLALNWSQLRWPLDEGRWHSETGHATLQLDEARLLSGDLEARLEGESLPTSRLQLNLSPQAAGQQRFRLAWDSAPGRLQAQGQLDAMTHQLEATLNLAAVDLSFWAADYPSTLAGELQLQATLANGPRVDVSTARIQGELRQAPVRLSAQGQWSPERLKLPALALDWGKGQLRGRLALDSHWQAELTASAPRLALWHPQLAGALEADLDVSGPRSAPRIRWTLRGRQLAAGKLTLHELRSTGRLGLGATDPLQLAVSLRQFTAPGSFVESSELNAQGTLSGWQGRLTLRETRGTVATAFRGGWKPDSRTLRLSLQDSELRLGDRRWTQQSGGVVTGRLGSDWNLPRHCWRSEGAQSCLAGRWQAGQVTGEFDLTDFPLSSFKPFLPIGTALSGEITAQAQIEPSPPDALKARLSVRSTPVEVTVTQNDETITLLALEPGRIEARTRGRSVSASLAWPLNDAPGLAGELEIGPGGQLDGRLRLGLKDIAVVSALVPEVLQADGRLGGELRFGGTLSAPRLAGEIALREGELQLDTPAITLQDLSLALQGDGGRDLRLAGSARSGAGEVQLGGRLAWPSGETLRVDAQIGGEDFLASNTPQARVLVSPDLKLAMRGREIRLTGTLTVPEALIRPKRLESSNVVLPDSDQVVLGSAQQAPARYRLYSQIQLVLGRQVRFEGFGLKTNIEGKLSSKVEPDRVPVAVGELKLKDGRYKAYGQDLTLERGLLIFSGGPITQPGVDLQAYRRPRPDILVGVKVRGTLDDPSFSLYSEPEMRETDQLSYLVLGRAAESQNEADQAAINNAALALGLKGGDFLAKRFKGKLGLDEVRIGAQPGESADQAALVLGKYLTPDIYVSYGIGLFEPVSVFKLRYRLSDKWSLQTESGVESGGDVLYTIER